MRSNIVLWLFGISVSNFIAWTVAHEALVGANEAGEHQFPYQVSVQTVHNRIHRHDCGGAIIDDQHILTAAHCVLNNAGQFIPKRFIVLVGSNNLNSIKEPAFKVDVVKIYVPANFTPPAITSNGDIAVLKLKSALELGVHSHLKRLKLPEKYDEDHVHKTVMIAGFGWDWIHISDDYEDGRNSDGHLRFAKADVITNTECEKQYHKEDLTWIQISDKKMCAKVQQLGTVTRGVCVGDSGSPLVLNGHIVIGILSLSPWGCSEKEQAAIYTRVSHYLDFIEHAIHDKQDDHIRTHAINL